MLNKKERKEHENEITRYDMRPHLRTGIANRNAERCNRKPETLERYPVVYAQARNFRNLNPGLSSLVRVHHVSQRSLNAGCVRGTSRRGRADSEGQGMTGSYVGTAGHLAIEIIGNHKRL